MSERQETSANGQHQQKPSITAEYEQKALVAFCAWYHQAQPTIKEASQKAYGIARDTVGNLTLTTTRVIQLLEEHWEWTSQKPEERYMTAIGMV